MPDKLPELTKTIMLKDDIKNSKPAVFKGLTSKGKSSYKLATSEGLTFNVLEEVMTKLGYADPLVVLKDGATIEVTYVEIPIQNGKASRWINNVVQGNEGVPEEGKKPSDPQHQVAKVLNAAKLEEAVLMAAAVDLAIHNSGGEKAHSPDVKTIYDELKKLL